METDNQDILIESLRALEVIRESKSSSKINLETLEKITPFFITALTGFLKKNPNIKIIMPKNNSLCSYLKTIKFPQTTNSLNTNKKTYTPLYELKTRLGSDSENGEIIDMIEKIIVENFNLKTNINILMSIFDELICNIQQHSNSNFNCIQAQMYDNKLAISLLDTGISIPQSYIRVGYKDEEDMQLFKLAFNGISTKDNKERGTGIPNIYNWVCKGLKGSMVIISKSCVFKKLPNEELEFINLKSKELNLKFEGTIINLLFEKPKTKINIYKHIKNKILTE